jgi:hypothetical protein
MSWLRNHMRQFVVPGIRTIARADGRALTDTDIKPCDKVLRPSTKCEYVEAGLLLSLVSSILPKGNKTREVTIALCRTVGKKSDADAVYQLDLGGRGCANRVKELGEGYDGVEGADVLHSFVTNSIKELKRRTRKQATAIYPGRDVWCWEVMSKKQGMPSLYDSRVSRSVAGNQKAVKKLIEPWVVPDWQKTILFDTGHAGTVPRAIGLAAGVENPNVVMLSAIDNEEQIFRTHAKSRRKALACEYLAKYHKRATVQNDTPYQELADLEEFIKSALLTIWLWYHVSPARLPAWRDEVEPPKKSGIRIAPASGLSVQTTPLWAASNTSTPIWVNASSVTSASSSVVWDTGTSISGGTWDLVSATTTLNDMWGQNAGTQMMADLVADQRKEIDYLKQKYEAAMKGVIDPPAVDPQSFALVDPVSKAPLEPAMDAKAQGLDPVQYQVQQSRAKHLNDVMEKASQTRGGPLKMYEPPPTGVQLDAGGKIIADNRPLPQPKKPDGLISLDKAQAYNGTTIDMGNYTSQSSPASGGPGSGATPTPTTPGKLQVVPIVGALPRVTDGSGKAITG